MNEEDKQKQLNYIRSQRERGVEDSVIRSALLEVGWKEEDVNVNFDFPELEELVEKSEGLPPTVESIQEKKSLQEKKEYSVLELEQEGKEEKTPLVSDLIKVPEKETVQHPEKIEIREARVYEGKSKKNLLIILVLLTVAGAVLLAYLSLDLFDKQKEEKIEVKEEILYEKFCFQPFG